MTTIKQYTVYKILHNGIVVYIGYTNNLRVRQYQHNTTYNKFKQDPVKYKKMLYKFLLNNGFNDTIELVPIKENIKSKVEAKRIEMYLILKYYFSKNNTLQQYVPNISDFR